MTVVHQMMPYLTSSVLSEAEILEVFVVNNSVGVCVCLKQLLFLGVQ